MDKTAQPTRAGLLAVAAAVAFTATWLVLGFVSDGYKMWEITVESYSPIAQPISGLGLGSTAPFMNTAFVLCGILISLGTWSAMRVWPEANSKSVKLSRGMVGTCGLGMATCGIFDLESIMLHSFGFLLAVGVPGLGFLLAARALRETAHHRLSTWLRFAGPITIISLIAFLTTFNGDDAGDNVGYAGLIQRVLVAVVMISVGAIGLSNAGRNAVPSRPATRVTT